MSVITGIADVFSGDVHVPHGTTLTDRLIEAKADGLVFLIAKATEGGLKVPPPFVDPKFHAWSGACDRAEIEFGSYHFMRNTDTGIVQAQFFYDTIVNTGRDPCEMFCALDFEPHRNHDGSETQPDPVIALDFVDEWETMTGKLPWIYCDQSRAHVLANFDKTLRSPVFGKCKWWGAGYGVPWVETKDWGKALIWQYIGAGSTGNELPHDQQTYPISFKGIGKVDRSAFAGTVEELLALIAA